MGYKKVIFAGFFLNREEKLQFTRLFDCDKKIFLESSRYFAKYNTELIKFFPMNIFHMQNHRIWNVLFNRVQLDPTFVDLYKNDLKIFKHVYKKDPLPKGIKTFAFFTYWVFRISFKSKVSFANFRKAFRTITNKGKSGNELGYVGENDLYYQVDALKQFAFRLAFINGYIYIKN